MKQLVDKFELSKLLKIPVSTIDYYRRQGRIDTIMIGKHPRYEPDKVIQDFRKNGHK